MDSRVYLNSSPLIILSIPRTKEWLFTSAILKLLASQASLTATESRSDYYLSLDSAAESDSENEALSRQESDDWLAASFTSSGSGSGGGIRKSSLARLSSQTDNSSKQIQLLSSSKDNLVDLSLSKTRTDDDETEQSVEESFFHIAYTLLECTVICSEALFNKLFRKPLSVCRKLGYMDVVLINEQFFSLQIDNEGLENGSDRILEFTQPLSELGISLFFLLSHFSDIVLIPQSSRPQVVQILASKNFVYSPNTNSYLIDNTQGIKEPGLALGLRDLQKRTQELFSTQGIRPKIHANKKCLLTGARPGEVRNSIDKTSACIAAGTVPEYFAITRTAIDEISLLLPGSIKRRSNLGFDARCIVGLSLDAIIPITVDLSKLPLDSTGIVAGLASSLLEAMKSDTEEILGLEMNYLSMACSAVIMIPEEKLTVVTEMVKSISLKSSEEAQ